MAHVVGPFLDGKGRQTVIVAETLTTGATLATHHHFRSAGEAAQFAQERGDGVPAVHRPRNPARPPCLRDAAAEELLDSVLPGFDRRPR